MIPTTDNIEETVREFFRDKPVKRVYLFGSYARGEENENSDVDLLFEYTEPFGLLMKIGMEQDLSDILGRKVDLISHGGIKANFLKYIKDDLRIIYEKS